jgi:REP element-mobilizing transposase RayT
MARNLRVAKIGFFHILNRGVEKREIFMDDDDYLKFLEILDDSATNYNFTIYSFCLMNNHYHLLLKTSQENLSLLMRQINSRYSIYFNNRYKRVGPLFQGRFKSWFVYDEVYLRALVKYIEFNPIKANIVDTIGQYRWSMSSYMDTPVCANYDILKAIDFNDGMSEKELNEVEKIYSAKFELKDDDVEIKKSKTLEEYFSIFSREFAIANAIKDGHTQTSVAMYLKLSNVSISKIYKTYKQKVQLFNKLRDKGIFWSYSKDITYAESTQNLFIEYLLKYGDFDDIKLGYKLFGKRVLYKVWDEKLKTDKRFIKLNLMLARIFFGMDVESNYFKEMKSERFEKFRLLAS